ncbi:MAG TPA: cation:proton antiporter [Candidatus Cloacimonadota bacterium]|nr:cation:proton antiporter [Candidatus Cloacimonadota bacterium]
MGPITEHHLLIFLVQFALLLGACKVAGYLLNKIKQPAITGEILVGLLLGPAVLGKYFPRIESIFFPHDTIQIAMLGTVAWFGNLFLLMETGLEINFTKIWQNRGNTVKLSFADLIIPILLTWLPMSLLPPRYMVDPNQHILFGLFIAAIMTISALPVAIRGMREMNVLKSDVGFLTISALTMNDLVGWVVFTIILGLLAHGGIELSYVARLILETLLFAVISLTLLRRIVDRSITTMHNKLGRETGYKITFMVILGMIMGAMTLRIGIHSLFGFFIAGIVVGEAKHISEKDRHVISRMVHSIFVPIFFARIGLEINILDNFDPLLVLIIVVLGIAARYIAAFIGAKWSGQDRVNSHTIAICHTPGGEMHIVIAMLGYELGVLTETVFVSIVAASILSTIIFGPWLSFAMRKISKNRVDIDFDPESVLLDVVAEARHDVVLRLAELAHENTKLPTDSIYQEIMKREELMSTATGNGVAIPHARLAGIRRPLLFIAKPLAPVDWDSPDGYPVDLVFLVITPADVPKTQLIVMQCLAGSLRNFGLAAKLRSSLDEDTIFKHISQSIASPETCQVIS